MPIDGVHDVGVQLPIAVLTTPRLRHHGRTHVRAYRGKNHGIQKQVLTDLGNQRFVVDGVPEKCLDGALFDFPGLAHGHERVIPQPHVSNKRVRRIVFHATPFCLPRVPPMGQRLAVSHRRIFHTILRHHAVADHADGAIVGLCPHHAQTLAGKHFALGENFPHRPGQSRAHFLLDNVKACRQALRFIMSFA